ncbi:NADPH-dependent assimilatory sulfite reductase hemoprotein subunit [Lignipirellula cremea]|uniref:Sulfite reductase [ferredoxin] n=1 Tax=Lignipirellula cremea TaxID=2528010 RepID=A0A518DZ91_9BACT|nr:NADPH-dependent assimilatory sulfite reductase hemoprotein subunit [Lignipirellula cremea]QDU97153.1 Sulfite reductase [ferredoxin] [Lignipirellula cremea]
MTAAVKAIRLYLVRYGAPGYVGRFGSVHRLECRRGDTVVVSTDRGVELGEVLADPEDLQPQTKQPTGEVLRLAESDDLQLAELSRQAAGELLTAAQEAAAKVEAGAVVVDAEVLLDGVSSLVYFLGPETDRFGPLAVRLSTNGLRVRFQRWEDVVQAAEGQTPGETPSAAQSSFPSVEEEAIVRTPREQAKHDSRFLREPLAAELQTPDKLSRPAQWIAEFHGLYQQTRPKVEAPASPGAGRHTFMLRVKAPGGKLTAGQFLALLQLAEEYGEAGLRLTARQGVQIHGVARGDLKAVLQRISDRLLTTFGACGDTCRNLVCCPAIGKQDRVRGRLQTLANELTRSLAPQSGAYFDLWIDDDPEPVIGETESIYGPGYLPRKLKIGLAPPDDNCVDLRTHDIGLLAIGSPDAASGLAGFQLYAGGGLGFSPSHAETFPQLALPIARLGVEQALPAVIGLVEMARDQGDRENRRRARMKYWVHDQGAEQVRLALGERLFAELPPPLLRELPPGDEHLGWRSQGDGLFCLGLPIPSGRIIDADDVRFASGLKAMLRRHAGPVRITPQQNLLLGDASPAIRVDWERLLAEHGVATAALLLPVVRSAMACPALPTCSLAVAEAERVLPAFTAAMKEELVRYGRGETPIRLAVSGCPHGCSRPLTADVGVLGVARRQYDLYLGGSGERLGWRAAGPLSQEAVIGVIRAWLQRFAEQPDQAIAFGPFVNQFRPA